MDSFLFANDRFNRFHNILLLLALSSNLQFKLWYYAGKFYIVLPREVRNLEYIQFQIKIKQILISNSIYKIDMFFDLNFGYYYNTYL